jgi:hypothetical protein
MKKIITQVEYFVDNPIGKFLGFICFVSIIFYYLDYSDESYASEYVNEINYYGCIYYKGLYNQKGAEFLFFNKSINQNDRLVYSIFSQEYIGLYDYASIGDTIIKEKGKGRITIKKAGGEEKKFEYNNGTLPNVE